MKAITSEFKPSLQSCSVCAVAVMMMEALSVAEPFHDTGALRDAGLD